MDSTLRRYCNHWQPHLVNSSAQRGPNALDTSKTPGSLMSRSADELEGIYAKAPGFSIEVVDKTPLLDLGIQIKVQCSRMTHR